MSEVMHVVEQNPESDRKTARILVTPEAAEFAKRKREQLGKPDAVLRIGVKGGGCAGFAYVTEFTNDPPRSRDLVYEFSGLTVYVDNRSLKYLEGSVLRYEETLMYQGFKFDNPLQESSCGCGMTFSVKKDALGGAGKQLRTQG
ncbi:MAG TPA: iron-sulfur cluster assembly accessory protein [Polyangiaceae bacterium]|jgi:iron-sulfur cluster assembly protein